MMPIKYSSIAAATTRKSPTALLSTIAKKRDAASILFPIRHQQPIKLSCRLPVNNAASSRMISTSPKSTTWAPLHARQHHQRIVASSQKRFQSSRNNPNSSNNTLATLSTLAHLLTAGTGTFASTLLALYLATVVETSAHEFLYENFPHWYDEVPLEELPTCLESLAATQRSIVAEDQMSLVVIDHLNNDRLVEGKVTDEFGSMGIDGWMDQSSGSLLNNELLADLKTEEPAATTTTTSPSAWQRKMTERRAGIILQEEQDFSRDFVPAGDSFSKSAKNGLAETKKIHEEAAMKLQERLMSVAMTA